MAVESSETSTTTTPRVETEQLETVVSCFSPPACPEYQTTSMATKTNWSGNQSHLSTKRTGGQNAGWKICQVHRRQKRVGNIPERQRDPKPKRFERLQVHGFGKEPKQGQGLGHNPDAIEMKLACGEL